MASWRESTPQHVLDDIDELFNALVPFGQQMLEEQGEFFPFAGAITVAGELEFIAGIPDLHDEHPHSQEVIAACMDGLANRRDEVRAWALVTDVRLATTGRDAIAIDSEHAEGQAIRAIMPYEKGGWFRRKLSYGALQAAPGERRIWSAE